MINDDHIHADDDIADIDPTPIHHPVDDEAIASAVNDAAVDDPMDPDHDHESSHHEDVVPHDEDEDDDDHMKPDESQFGDNVNDSTPSITELNSKEEDLTMSSNSNPKEVEGSEADDIRAMIMREDEDNAQKKEMKRRARRVGKVPVRKVPRLGDAPVMESIPTTTTTTTTTAESASLPMPEPVAPEEPTAVMDNSASTEPIPRVLSKHDEKWNLMLKELENFKEKHGHTNVPQCYTQNSRLGRWVHYQRVEYWVFQETGGGKITPDRIARLDAVGFEWDPQKAQWDKMFERLKEYYDEMGHCKVPKGYTHDPELANWVRNQRLEHANMNKGKKSRMTKERFKKLDDLGFKWSSITAKSKPLTTLKDAASSTGSENPIKADETTNVPTNTIAPTDEIVAQHIPLKSEGDSTNETTDDIAVKAESIPEELPQVGTEQHSEMTSPPKPLQDEADKPSSPIEI